MINLLTVDQKKELRAARLNTALLNYVVIASIALGALIILALFSSWWLSNRISVSKSIQDANTAETAPYADTKAQGEAFKGNLSKIESVISNRSHFGSAITRIAAALPAGVSLQTLDLSPSLVTTPLKLTVTTRDYSSALAIKQQLIDSKVFKTVSLDNADCPASSSCTVSITAALEPNIYSDGTAS